MKKWKPAVFGFIAGAMTMVTVTALGAYSQVTVSLFPDVTFRFDGERVASPSDQPVLNYQGYTYVPLRFVAETLNAEVNWDAAARLVDVVSDKKTYIKEVPVEKIVYVEKDEMDSDTVVYEKLPAKERQNDHVVTVTGISRDETTGYTKVFINVENRSDSDVIQVVPSSAELTVDGEQYDVFSLTRYWDQKWETSDIQYDEERDGYLIFDLIPEDYEKVDLTFTIRTQGGDTEKYTFHFINEVED